MWSPSANIYRFAFTTLALSLAACPIDDRRLSGESDQAEGGDGPAGAPGADGGTGAEPTAGSGGKVGSKADGGSSGGPSGGSGGSEAGSSGSGGSGGNEGGAGGEGGEFGAGGCGDLDHNSVQDCEETIVENSRFDVDVTGWEAEPTLEQEWDERNAWHDEVSGALSIVNDTVIAESGFTMGGSRQCLPAVGGKTYQFAALIFIPVGQEAGSAGMNIGFWGADDCADFPLSTTTTMTTPVTEAGVWRVSSGSIKAPPATRSVVVRLVATKQYEQPALEALFDNVLVRAK